MGKSLLALTLFGLMVGSFFIGSVNSESAQTSVDVSKPTTLWNNTYLRSLGAIYVTAASDRGYFIVGYTADWSEGFNSATRYVGGHWTNYTATVWKVQDEGGWLWSKNYPVNPAQCTSTSDGGLAIVGSEAAYISVKNADSSITMLHHTVLVKLDNLGDQQWSVTLDALDNMNITSLIQTVDGGYMIGGSSPKDSYYPIAQIVKIGINGLIQWTHTYGNSGKYNTINSIVQTLDGSLGIAGETTRANGVSEFWFIKTSFDGFISTEKVYGYGAAKSIIATSDNGFLLAGYVYMSPSVDTYLDSYLVKTDFDGNAEWNMTYVNPLESHELTSVVEDSDGGYLLLGHAYNDLVFPRFYGNMSAIVTKVDSTGQEQWTLSYPVRASRFYSITSPTIYPTVFVSQIILGRNGGVLFVGTKEVNGSQFTAGWAIKISEPINSLLPTPTPSLPTTNPTLMPTPTTTYQTFAPINRNPFDFPIVLVAIAVVVSVGVLVILFILSKQFHHQGGQRK
jgi:hypothetical protein